jgi:hypothetical protein
VSESPADIRRASRGVEINRQLGPLLYTISVCARRRRIALGLRPNELAAPLARLEPYGMMILIGVLFILPVIGAKMGLDFPVDC